VKPSTKSEAPGDHPAPPGVAQVGAADPGDVGEIAGHERQDARGEEGDESAEYGDRQGEQQGPAETVCWGRCGGYEQHVSSLLRDDRVEHLAQLASLSAWSARAAILPSRSMTIVEGMACGLRVPFLKRSISLPVGSYRLGYGTPYFFSKATAGLGAGVAGVEADELDVLVRRGLGDLDQVVRLGAARGAPGAPHVDDEDLALVVGGVELLPSMVLPDRSGAAWRSPFLTVAMPSEPVMKLVLPEPPEVPPELHADSTNAATATPAVDRTARLRARLAALM
jgi:hypothetical protein